MKIILAILCALVVLFAGGCAVMLLYDGVTGTSGAFAVAIIPAVIAVLNAMALLAILGKEGPRRPVFYILAGLDVVGAALAAKFWSAISFQVGDIWTLAAPVMAVLLVKAALTIMVARKLPAA